MKTKWFNAFLVVMMSVIGSVSLAAAEQAALAIGDVTACAEKKPELTRESLGLWFVELSGSPVSEGNTSESVAQEHNNFRKQAKKENIAYKERYSYRSLWNGFSVAASAADIGKLSRLPGVVGIHPVRPVPVPETFISSFEPDLYTALAMTGADVAQSELGYTGAGIRVAVMDTGIDYDHPDLGGCFGPGCRVATGWDFVGDDYDFNTNPVPTPDSDPDDCNGHGTHVAGIVGASGSVDGVAPDVTFGAYRVFGCEGSTGDDIMLAAMERAYKDKMQVLNMSIGSPFDWPQAPTAVAASRLVKKGIVVVASIGNDGSLGLYTAGAPGLGEEVIGVASFDNTHARTSIFTVNSTDIGYIPMSESGLVPTSGSGKIVDIGRACDVDLPLPANPAGKVALVERGICTFVEKATNAINAGASAVVIYNNSAGQFSGSLNTQIGDGSVPVVSISGTDGAFIKAQAAPVTLTWTDRKVSMPNPTGGLISSFSSYGLAPDLALKPDIGAPGGTIYSTYPLEKSGYASLGGTSMSSPHVAGAVALLLQAAPKTKAGTVRSILQNSAVAALWWGDPGLGYLDSVNRQGAGMLQIDDAITAQAVVVPGKLSLGESQQGPATRLLTITNNTDTSITYDLSYESGLTTSGLMLPDFWSSFATVTFSTDSITLAKKQKGKINVTITAPNEPFSGQYGGWVVFTPSGGGQALRVPFAGFIGDYQSIEVLANLYDLPRLVDFSWNDATSFSLVGNDLPYFQVHLDHQSRVFKMEVFNADTNKSIGMMLQLDYMLRNSLSSEFFEFPWNGTTTSKKKAFTAPNGDYYVKISVLKALGDAKNPADWENWTSPVFTLARP